jgi:hypothetical protein
MAKEKEWVEAVADRIRTEGQLMELEGISVRVDTGARLHYTRELSEYEEKRASKSRAIDHQTDLLLYDQLDNRWWAPRVVIECILGEVTSNDALIFSAKAARHKHVHSYLRYGILIGGNSLFSVPPVRMFRHGDRFDFIASWSDEKASEGEWALFVEILKEEVQRSRTIQELFTTNQDLTAYSIVHRQLSFK